MPVEIGLADGTKLTLANPSADPDDVLEALERTLSFGQSTYLNVESTGGMFRVNAHQVVYVRDVPG